MTSAVHEIPELDRKGLRQFGLITGGIVAGLFGLFFPWLLQRALPLWPWVVFGILALWSVGAPRTLRHVYRTWMRFGLLISRITTPVVLGIVYFGVISPMALVMRVAGRDPMARRFDKKIQSYRIPSRKVTREHMEKPF